MDYILHVATVILLYAGLVASLNLLIGHAGILSFAHASFYGIGAYVTAMLTVYAGWDWLPAVAAAVVVTAAIAFLIGVPTLRLGGDYFVLALFGFQLIVVDVILNLDDVTNGPFGIRGIPRPSVNDYRLASGWPFLIGTAVVTGVLFLTVRRIVTSPLGGKLHAVRDDETVAAALGINVARTKIMIFTVAAALAAVIGAMTAFYFRFVEANAFNSGMNDLALGHGFCRWHQVALGRRRRTRDPRAVSRDLPLHRADRRRSREGPAGALRVVARLADAVPAARSY